MAQTNFLADGELKSLHSAFNKFSARILSPGILSMTSLSKLNIFVLLDFWEVASLQTMKDERVKMLQ